MSCKQISGKGFAKFWTTFLQDKSTSYIMFRNRSSAVKLLQNVNPSTDFSAVCSCVRHSPSLFSRFPLLVWDNNSTYHPELLWYWKNGIRCGSNLRVILSPFLPRGHLAKSRDTFGCHNWQGRVLLVPSG